MDQKERQKKVVEMLSNYKSSKVAVAMLLLDLQTLESLAAGSDMAVEYDQVTVGQTNHVISKTEQAVIKLEQQRKEIHTQIMLLQNQIAKIEMALSNMTYPYKRLLELKYIEHKRWIDVYKALNYSEEYVRTKINKAALDMIAGYMFPEALEIDFFET